MEGGGGGVEGTSADHVSDPSDDATMMHDVVCRLQIAW